MKILESVINDFQKTKDTSLLPDISKEKYLKVNSLQDGYHGRRQGGHVYLIKKDGDNYSIYGAHTSKVKTVRRGNAKEPQTVDGFYLDDVAIVQTRNDEVYFEEKDAYSPYNIISKVNKKDIKSGDNKLYAALVAFYAYVLSEYQFTDAYPSDFVPPIEICGLNNVPDTPAPAPTPSPSTPSNSGSGSGGTTPSTPRSQSDDEPVDKDADAESK